MLDDIVWADIFVGTIPGSLAIHGVTQAIKNKGYGMGGELTGRLAEISTDIALSSFAMVPFIHILNEGFNNQPQDYAILAATGAMLLIKGLTYTVFKSVDD